MLAKRYGAKGLVIATHANMGFEAARNDGWTATRQAIVATAADFGGPVAFLHGDTHIFRTDRLLLKSHGLENFTRVECFGSPFTWQWVTIAGIPRPPPPSAPTRNAAPPSASTRTTPEARKLARYAPHQRYGSWPDTHHA